MKKTSNRLHSLFAALVALVLAAALAVPAFAVEGGFADLYYRMFDDAEVLTEDEDNELEDALEELSLRQSFDVTIATIESMESVGADSMEQFADSPNLIVAPVTSNTVKKPDHQAHVLVDGNRAFLQPSMILAKSVQTISKGRLIRPMGRLSIPELIRLNYALLYQLDLNEWVWRKEAYERYSLYGECVEMNGKKKTLNRSLQTYMDGTGMGLNFDNSDRRPLTPQFPIKSGKHK